MGRPVGNGLIEIVDEKSKERGFFCMKLVDYIIEEEEELIDIELWEKRFSEAKAGQCAYGEKCPIYARTITKRGKQPVQLTIKFQ